MAAKNVRFGVPYGRSAEALSRQCREEGSDVPAKDCQRLIDNYMDRYQPAAKFLNACEARPYSDEHPYIVGAYGRIRRFQKVDDPTTMSNQGRSAKNFPIQNLVADYILLIMYYLRRLREQLGLQHAFRVVLQIHDAVMLEVKIPYIGIVRDLVREVVDMVPIMPRTLDGAPFFHPKTGALPGCYLHNPGKPYKFQVDLLGVPELGSGYRAGPGQGPGDPRGVPRGRVR